MLVGASDYKCVWNNETLQFDQKFDAARFSVGTFYFIMFGWMCVASLSFYLINSHAEKIESLTCSKASAYETRSGFVSRVYTYFIHYTLIDLDLLQTQQ